MTIGIIYFNHRLKHLARLVASLYSLRHHYAGPVTILDTGQTDNKIDLLRADEHLHPRIRTIPFVERRRNSCYVTKASLWRHSPYDVTLFLDADTVVVREPSKLITWAMDPAQPGIVVTRFSKWHTKRAIIRKRVRRWSGVRVPGGEPPLNAKQMAARAIEYPWPAVNTGVVAWRKDAEILSAWERLTQAGQNNPFTDELAMQLLITQFEHTLGGDEWNASPLYHQAPANEVCIWHCHGNKHVLRKQSERIWPPVWRECWAKDVASVRSWAPGADHRLGVWMEQEKRKRKKPPQPKLRKAA